jgi:hypothetical protein
MTFKNVSFVGCYVFGDLVLKKQEKQESKKAKNKNNT